MEIRRASDSQADELSALALAAKSHWGYAKDLLQHWRPHLSITAEEIRTRPTFVIVAGDKVAGFYALQPGDDAWKLEHFGWIPHSWDAASGHACCGTHCRAQ